MADWSRKKDKTSVSENMNIYFHSSAFLLLRQVKINKLIIALNRTYDNQRYELAMRDKYKNLIQAHPIRRKPISDCLFAAEINKEWVVIFDDKINTDGCDPLMYNLNRLFQYEGLTAQYGETDTLPGTMLTYYRGKSSRVIQSYLDGTKWVFYTEGDVLEFENPDYYKARLIRNRFNVTILNEYFEKLQVPAIEILKDIITTAPVIYCIKKTVS
jgi:hypothetical protein